MLKKLLLFTIFIASACQATTLEQRITGIKKTEQKNILLRLKNQQQIFPLKKENVKQIYQDTRKQIKLGLEPFGYFKPSIRSQLYPINKDSWIAVYEVRPGKQMQISRLTVTITGEGKNQPEFLKLLTKFPLHESDPLLMEKYNTAKAMLFDTAQKLGYLDANLQEHVIKINLKQYTAAITLTLETGHRYYFGSTYFYKNPLSDRFLQRFVHFKKNQPYSSEDLLILQKNLNDSNFYQQVLVKPKRQKTKNYHVPIEVSLTPLKSQQYSFGIGYGTDTGPRASVGWDWRYLTDTGHRFSSLLRFSPIQNTVQAIYVIPGKNPLTDEININTSLLNNKLPKGENILSKTGVANISNIAGWQQSLSLSFQRERYRFLNQTDYHYSKLLLAGASWQRTASDNTLYPLNGYRLNLNIQGSYRNFYSDTSLVQLLFNGKYIHQIGKKGRILLKTDLGYTTVHDNSVELPLSLSFFAGGARSVRGYAYQALGPGRYLITGSIEYQHQIIKNWNAAVFFDMGNAFQNMPETHRLVQSLQQGIGIGAVWISPVGPINLSIAKAINWPGQPLQIQFSMGPDL